MPTNEFTISDAAHASKLGDYQTIQMGKWHLGDFWDKKLPGMNKLYPVSNPVTSGHFDTWFTTEAEVSSSKSNCGCYPVDNGPMPTQGAPITACKGAKPNRLPSGGTAGCNLTYFGDKCVVNGGVEGKWAFPCTDYYYPNASDPRTVK